jgi:hypothetical protein
MIELFGVLLLLASVACLFRLEFLIPTALLVGFLQDPLRKVIEGQPVYFVVLVGVSFMAAFVGLFLRNGFSIFDVLSRWSPAVRLPLALFVCLIFFQALNSLFSYDNIILTGIGVMSYTAPIFAMIVGYYAFDNNERIWQLFRIYLVGGAFLVLTVYLSFLGFDWEFIKEVGAGLIIYDQGTVIQAHSGFMRSSEIAAWHMASATCFLIIVNVSSKKPVALPLSVLFGLILFVGVILTGRRKMIVQVVQFCGLYGVLYFYFRQSLSLSVMLLAAFFMFLLWLAIELLFPGGYGDTFSLYLARGASVFGDMWDRMINLGLLPITWAYNRVGLIGGGVGIGSQGGQFFGGGGAIYGGAAEGGLGKIMLELGVLGLLLLPWLAATFFAFFIKSVKFSQAFSPENAPIVIGVFAFILTNIPTFIIASSVFGDLYVLSILGLLASYLLAVPKLTLLVNPAIVDRRV